MCFMAECCYRFPWFWGLQLSSDHPYLLQAVHRSSRCLAGSNSHDLAAATISCTREQGKTAWSASTFDPTHCCLRLLSSTMDWRNYEVHTHIARLDLLLPQRDIWFLKAGKATKGKEWQMPQYWYPVKHNTPVMNTGTRTTQICQGWWMPILPGVGGKVQSYKIA
jgi:hypothetical protein